MPFKIHPNQKSTNASSHFQIICNSLNFHTWFLKITKINTKRIYSSFRVHIDHDSEPRFEQSESRILTILVGYDVWIDVIDRLLGLGVDRSCCTCIRRVAHDGSVLWTSGAAVRVLPVERRQDSSYGQGQKGRCCREAQQQRAQHWRVRVPCHGTNGKRSINRNFHFVLPICCVFLCFLPVFPIIAASMCIFTPPYNYTTLYTHCWVLCSIWSPIFVRRHSFKFIVPQVLSPSFTRAEWSRFVSQFNILFCEYLKYSRRTKAIHLICEKLSKYS